MMSDKLARGGFAWLVLVGLLFLAPASAQDHDAVVAEVTAAVQTFYAAWNSGKVDDAFNQMKVGSSGFLSSGGLMVSVTNQAVHDEQLQKYKGMLQAGAEFDLTPKHIDVMPLGGQAAVASFYVEGTVTLPDGPEAVLNRVSVVWQKDDEETGWQMVHWHISPLMIGG
jgi:ketosteroid isomerase-like protein